VSEEISDPMVYTRHLRQARYCVRVARLWAVQNDLDFDKFVREGVRASELEATGDALGIKLARIARDEAAAKNGTGS
jgi:hypothetical protein